MVFFHPENHTVDNQPAGHGTLRGVIIAASAYRNKIPLFIQPEVVFLVNIFQGIIIVFTDMIVHDIHENGNTFVMKSFHHILHFQHLPAVVPAVSSLFQGWICGIVGFGGKKVAGHVSPVIPFIRIPGVVFPFHTVFIGNFNVAEIHQWEEFHCIDTQRFNVLKSACYPFFHRTPICPRF